MWFIVQKACSNDSYFTVNETAGLKLILSVSLGEIERALVAGFPCGRERSEIIFTADLLDEKTIERVVELDIPVNAGSIDMLRQLGERHQGPRCG